MAKLPETLGGRKSAGVSRQIHSVDTGAVARQAERSAQQLVNAGRDVSQIAVGRAREEDDLRRNRNRHIKNDARRQLEEFTKGTADTEGLFSRMGSNGVSIEKDYDDRFKQIRDKAMKDAGDGRYSEALGFELDDLNDSYRGRMLSHQTKQRTDYGAEVASANASQAINDIGYAYNDDVSVEKNLKVVEASLKVMGDAQGWGEATIKTRLREGRSEAYATQIDSMIATDNPHTITQAYEKYQKHNDDGNLTLATRSKLDNYFDTAMPVVTAKIEYDNLSTSMPTEPEDIANFIISELEVDKNNPDAWHIDNDGGVVKYGINQKHNPDVDVKSLTREEAVNITINDYYSKVGGSDLPENMRMVAADAAFNHGPSKAKKMVKQANGDVHKLIALRKKEYDRLKAAGQKSIRDGKGDPHNWVGSHAGWIGRLQDVEDKLSSGGSEVTGEAVYARAIELDRETPGAGQELIGMYENTQAKKKKAEAVRKVEMTNDARTKLAEFEGDYTQFTTKERAEYAESGIDVTSLYKDFDEPGAETELILMDSDTLLNTDIDTAYGDRLKFETLSEWKEKQELLKDPANKHVEDNIKGVVNRFFFEAGLDPNETTGKDSNSQYMASMTNYIQQSLVDIRKQGKEVTPKMLNEVAADYVLSNKATLNKGALNFWNNDKDALMFDYSDIPSKDRVTIRNSLLERGQPATDEQILSQYISEVGVEEKAKRVEKARILAER